MSRDPRAPARSQQQSARGVALAALIDVIGNGRSLSDRIHAMQSLPTVRDRALASQLTYGVLRFAPRLAKAVDMLATRPIKAKDGDLRVLLMLGLYQLGHTRIPAHAAVAETTELAASLGKRWARHFVNAVLRGYIRSREEIERRLDADPVGRLMHPQWLLDELRSRWPDDWEQIAQQNNGRAPMTLRVNRRRQSRDDYRALLAERGIACEPTRHSDVGIILAEAMPTTELPGFAQGRVSVQDESPQLAAPLLGVEPGHRILDACSAPGGKACHLAERNPPSCPIDALDLVGSRLASLGESTERLGLEIRCIEGDAAQPKTWWDGTPYDRILVDAPCSATGVIRRWPDIKLHRKATDIESSRALQLKILCALWPLLTPGGRLLYATCSVLSPENDGVIESFLAQRHDASLDPFDVQWGRPTATGRQVLPGDDAMDGFFYARLAKA